MKPQSIKKIRQSMGMTQVEFADYLGMAPVTISSYETGVRRPSKYVVKLIRYVEKEIKNKPATA